MVDKDPKLGKNNMLEKDQKTIFRNVVRYMLQCNNENNTKFETIKDWDGNDKVSLETENVFYIGFQCRVCKENYQKSQAVRVATLDLKKVFCCKQPWICFKSASIDSGSWLFLKPTLT